MEKEKLQVVISKQFNKDIALVHQYGTETFGLKYADLFVAEIFEEIKKLTYLYAMHLECKHIPTKSQMYRNVIIGSYLIIYRITNRVEVLKVLHGSKSPTAIRKTRSVVI